MCGVVLSLGLHAALSHLLVSILGLPFLQKLGGLFFGLFLFYFGTLKYSPVFTIGPESKGSGIDLS